MERERMADALSRYDIGDELGRGAWGVVYAARHRDLDREVAVKALPRAFGADPDVRSRFLKEAKVLASLTHPHIVQIHDFVEHEGLCLLVMERLDGGTLTERFRAGLSREESLAAVLASCEGLQRAHDLGVLHRDVKPDNMMFTASGTLKVTDFGIAKVLGGSQTVATVAGMVLGTPAYMAPEQACGGELSQATDVYALAVIVYELFTGRLPFPESGDLGAMLRARAFSDPLPITDVAPDVPSPLARVVMHGLAQSPDDRYGSAQELGAALAGAANEVYGSGWLGRQSVVEVLASGAIAQSLATTAPAGAPPPRQSQVIRPSTETRVSTPAPPPPEPEPEDIVPVQEMLAESPLPTEPPAVHGRVEPPSPAPAAPSGPPPGPGRRPRWPLLAGAAALVVAAVVAGVLLLGGGDDGDDGSEGEEVAPEVTEEPAPTTTEADEPPEVAAYEDFTEVTDDTGTLLLEVPVEWSDTDGRSTDVGADIQVAPDLEGFLDEAHDVPGVEFGALPADTPPDIVLDTFADTFGADCTVVGDEAYDDGLYVGDMRTLDCGDGASVVAVAAAPEDGAYILGVAVELVSQADDAALQRILETFRVDGDPLAPAG